MSNTQKHKGKVGIVLKEYKNLKKILKKILYLKVFLKIVEINFFIRLSIDVCMILKLRTLKIMKKLN